MAVYDFMMQKIFQYSANIPFPFFTSATTRGEFIRSIFYILLLYLKHILIFHIMYIMYIMYICNVYNVNIYIYIYNIYIYMCRANLRNIEYRSRKPPLVGG